MESPEKTEETKIENAIELLKEQCETLKEKIKDQEDQILRIAADGENERKALVKQLNLIKVNSVRSFAEVLADHRDQLLRAISTINGYSEKIKSILEQKKINRDSICEELKNIDEQLEMINSLLLQKMKMNQVVPMEVKPGDIFDPQKHEAIDTLSLEEKVDEDRIGIVFQDGYLLGEKILRCAMVSVIKKSVEL